MEVQPDGGEGSLGSVKDILQRLEARIEAQHSTQLELLSSLQVLVPDIVSSLDLSLKVLSSFNGRHFVPTPILPDPKPPKNLEPFQPLTPPNRANSSEAKPTTPTTQSRKPSPDSETGYRRNDEKLAIEKNGTPLLVVRSMVAVCLLERVPFSAIDSSTVLRKLENDQNATPGEKAALHEVGGESGAILAVEMALRSMAEENGGVELEEFVVSGKSRVMVLGIDRTRLMKELPESANYQQQESSFGDNQQAIGGGIDMSGGVFGMGGPLPRPIPDMWMGPPGAMMGPRGGPRGVGIMPRGMSFPSMHRPPLGPHFPMTGSNAMPQKARSEEDEMKYDEVLLNKKSFREMHSVKMRGIIASVFLLFIDLSFSVTGADLPFNVKLSLFQPAEDENYLWFCRCKAFSTYPQTYDLLHLDGPFTAENHRCEMKYVLLEMDRILQSIRVRNNSGIKLLCGRDSRHWNAMGLPERANKIRNRKGEDSHLAEKTLVPVQSQRQMSLNEGESHDA